MVAAVFTVPPPGSQLRSGEQQVGGGGQHRHAPRPGESPARKADAKHQGCQGAHRRQRAAKIVKDFPPGQKGQRIVLGPTLAIRNLVFQPGQQLPVPPDPSVEPGKIAVHFIGAAVGQLHFPQQARPEVAALQ